MALPARPARPEKSASSSARLGLADFDTTKTSSYPQLSPQSKPSLWRSTTWHPPTQNVDIFGPRCPEPPESGWGNVTSAEQAEPPRRPRLPGHSPIESCSNPGMVLPHSAKSNQLNVSRRGGSSERASRRVQISAGTICLEYPREDDESIDSGRTFASPLKQQPTQPSHAEPLGSDTASDTANAPYKSAHGQLDLSSIKSNLEREKSRASQARCKSEEMPSKLPMASCHAHSKSDHEGYYFDGPSPVQSPAVAVSLPNNAELMKSPELKASRYSKKTQYRSEASNDTRKSSLSAPSEGSSSRMRRCSRDESEKSSYFAFLHHKPSGPRFSRYGSSQSASLSSFRDELDKDCGSLSTSAARPPVSPVSPESDLSRLKRKSRLRNAISSFLTPRKEEHKPLETPATVRHGAGSVSGEYFGPIVADADLHDDDTVASPGGAVSQRWQSRTHRPHLNREEEGKWYPEDMAIKQRLRRSSSWHLANSALEDDENDAGSIPRDVLWNAGSLSDSRILTTRQTIKHEDTEKDWFRQRIDDIMGGETEEEEEDQFPWDIPLHLPNSPLCPLSPKYRGEAKVCIYHGRRKTETRQESWRSAL